MKTYHADQRCPYGLYISPRGLDLKFVGSDGETLSGKGNVAYYRMPSTLLILMSPFIGGLFVLAFPFIALGLTVGFTCYSIGKWFWSLFRARPHLATMRWDPMMAYLAHPKDKGNKAGKTKDEKQKPEDSE